MNEFDHFLNRIFSSKVNHLSLKFDLFIMSLIFISSLVFVLETAVETQFQKYLLTSIDLFIMIIFTIEFFLRLYAASDKKKFLLSWYTWIDIMAIFPYWMGAISFLNFRVLRLLRIFRTFRFLRYSSKYDYEDSEKSILALERLFMFRTFFTIFLLVFVASSFIYEIEHFTNPGINNFLDAFYFTMVSVATVGYGDITPVTYLSKFIIMFTTVFMVIFVPTQLSNLIKHMHDADNKNVKCHACGLSIHEDDAMYCRNCGKKLIH